VSSNQDRTLTCADCGAEFMWSAGEQDYYDYKGFAPPKRCKPCREARQERKKRNAARGELRRAHARGDAAGGGAPLPPHERRRRKGAGRS
jgi:hypothetical protein